MVAIPGVLIGGIARGPGPQETVIREWLPSNHQPFLGSRAFALDPRLHPAPDYLDSIGFFIFCDCYASSYRDYGHGEQGPDTHSAQPPTGRMACAESPEVLRAHG